MVYHEGLRAHHEEMRKHSEARREAIFDTVVSSDQPLTAGEVAFALNLDPTNVRPVLRKLVNGNMLYSRVETSKERLTRFGSVQPSAAPAYLYSGTSGVPERVKRVVIPGFVAARNRVTKISSARDIDDKCFAFLQTRGPRMTVTIRTLAEGANIHYESARSRITRLLAGHAIAKNGVVSGTQTYRIANKEAMRVLLNQPVTEQLELPTPATPPVPELPAMKTKVATNSEASDERQVLVKLSELAVLQGEMTRLRAENERLRNTTPSVVSLDDLINGRG